MRDSLSYNGYVGSVHFNADDEVFYGKIVGVDDLVTFEGTTVADLATSFRECGWPRRGRTYAAGRVTHLHPAKGISNP